jgi:transposase
VPLAAPRQRAAGPDTGLRVISGHGGRPTKLTPILAERITWLVAHGVTLQAAAVEVGIGRATLHRWLSDERPAYRRFAEAIDRAEAEAEASMVVTLMRKQRTDWRAAYAWLQARHPERWPRRDCRCQNR